MLCLFSLGCSVKSETAEEHLSHAMKNIAAAEYQKAEKELQEVLRLELIQSERQPASLASFIMTRD